MERIYKLTLSIVIGVIISDYILLPWITSMQLQNQALEFLTKITMAFVTHYILNRLKLF